MWLTCEVFLTGQKMLFLLRKQTKSYVRRFPQQSPSKYATSAVNNNAALYSLFFFFKCHFNKLNETSVKKKGKFFFILPIPSLITLVSKTNINISHKYTVELFIHTMKLAKIGLIFVCSIYEEDLKFDMQPNWRFFKKAT